MIWTIYVAAVIVMSVLLAGIMIPQILLIAFRKNLFDEPDGRKIHKSLVPRLGGLAFVPVIAFTMAFLCGVDIYLGYKDFCNDALANAMTMAFCFCAVMMLYIVGLADDLIGVKYRAKFVVQVVCVAFLVIGGLDIRDLHGVLWLNEVPRWVMLPTTVLLGVFMINAINLIDGIDGLASGLSAVAAMTYGAAFFVCHQYLYSLLAFATFGVLLPFFYYNVFGSAQKRKKIFMGDTGSLTIGIILCILGLKMMQMPESSQLGGINMFVLASSPLMVPCFDVIRVFTVRIRQGRNPFEADQNHIHHRLLDKGLTQRQTMMAIVVTSALFVIVNVVLSQLVDVNVVVLVDILTFTVGVRLVSGLTRRRRNVSTPRPSDLVNEDI